MICYILLLPLKNVLLIKRISKRPLMCVCVLFRTLMGISRTCCTRQNLKSLLFYPKSVSFRGVTSVSTFCPYLSPSILLSAFTRNKMVLTGTEWGEQQHSAFCSSQFFKWSSAMMKLFICSQQSREIQNQRVWHYPLSWKLPQRSAPTCVSLNANITKYLCVIAWVKAVTNKGGSAAKV